MSYTIGHLAKAFGLSRSTLLYYDKIGLLKPTTRSDANYRCYGEAAYQRLEKIMTYRKTGLSLEEIQKLLEGEHHQERSDLLTAQLARINEEIHLLRRQQQIILEMLGHDTIQHPTRSMTKQQWVELLRSIGLSEAEMIQWHREFELRMPDAHQDFLESLHIPEEEIQRIRKL